MAQVLRQPASLTLWTYLEIQDADRITYLIDRSSRYEEASLTALASWNGKEFNRLDSEFRATLKTHPDPVIAERARAEGREQARKLIEAYMGGGKGPRRVAP